MTLAILCDLSSLLAICSKRIFGKHVRHARHVWTQCKAVVLLGEMRFGDDGSDPRCQVALYVHVGWWAGFSAWCNFCMAALRLNEHGIMDGVSIVSFFRLSGLHQAVSLQLTIADGKLAGKSGEGPQLPYPWAWCDMRCGDFVDMRGMPRNGCCLCMDRLCYTCCAVRCMHVHEWRGRVAEHVRYLHAHGADIRSIADMIEDDTLSKTPGKQLNHRENLWKCCLLNYGDRRNDNHRTEAAAQRTGGATPTMTQPTATSTTCDQPVFARQGIR